MVGGAEPHALGDEGGDGSGGAGVRCGDDCVSVFPAGEALSEASSDATPRALDWEAAALVGPGLRLPGDEPLQSSVGPRSSPLFFCRGKHLKYKEALHGPPVLANRRPASPFF